MTSEHTLLARFVAAQTDCYDQVLAELQAGHKRSHWIWFIFPQLTALGHSHTAHYYGLPDLAAARAYLAHPLLGARLRQCADLLLQWPGDDIRALLGSPDDLKLRSCMTLFSQITDDPVFTGVLRKYYGGQPDPITRALLRGTDLPRG